MEQSIVLPASLSYCELVLILFTGMLVGLLSELVGLQPLRSTRGLCGQVWVCVLGSSSRAVGKCKASTRALVAHAT